MASSQGDEAHVRRQDARERTLLARERSLSAWMRTGLAAIAGGFVIAKLAEDAQPAWLAVIVGVSLSAAGAAMVAMGYWNYRRVARRLEKEGIEGVPLWAVAAMSIVIVLAALGGAALLLR